MQKKTKLLDKLYEQDGHTCHYCGIQEGDFRKLWGEKFYGGTKRGGRLEVEHKDAVVIKGNEIVKMEREDTPEKCVLACALCNMAKSNMFTYEEFKKVGKVIEKIWRQRQRSGLRVKD
ncbi:hypothetical protein ACFLXC_04325 [Chloroflexota bacterium]